MGRRPKAQKTPQEKWQIVLEGLKSGNIAETCRWYEIAPALYCRKKPRRGHADRCRDEQIVVLHDVRSLRLLGWGAFLFSRIVTGSQGPKWLSRTEDAAGICPMFQVC